MTCTEIRIAVAEALGWRIHRGEYFAQIEAPDGHRGHCCGLQLTDEGVWCEHTTPHPEVTVQLPNYPADLNACAEMEESIVRDGQTRAYYEELVAVTKCDRFFLISATARQRCESFLRVKGLWKD